MSATFGIWKEEEENADNTVENGTGDTTAEPASDVKPDMEVTSEAINNEEEEKNGDNAQENGIGDEAAEPECIDKPETEATLEASNEYSE